MSDHYILAEDGRTPIPVDMMTWARWMNDADRKVRATKFASDGINVSTVFLGLDHRFGEGPPLIFETMIFGGKWNDGDYCERCSTWEEAEQMHERALNLVYKELKIQEN